MKCVPSARVRSGMQSVGPTSSDIYEVRSSLTVDSFRNNLQMNSLLLIHHFISGDLTIYPIELTAPCLYIGISEQHRGIAYSAKLKKKKKKKKKKKERK